MSCEINILCFNKSPLDNGTFAVVFRYDPFIFILVGLGNGHWERGALNLFTQAFHDKDRQTETFYFFFKKKHHT